MLDRLLFFDSAPWVALSFAVARLDADLPQGIRQLVRLAQDLGVGHRAQLAGLTLPDDGALVGLAACSSAASMLDHTVHLGRRRMLGA